MKQERSRNEKIFIWFIFIFSAIVLLDCFFYLEFWYAVRLDGEYIGGISLGPIHIGGEWHTSQNGFHILNTDYSIFYWFSHVSYLSCLFITLWSGFEVLSLYIPKYRPKFIFRYFALFWITLTMVGESALLPSMMQPRWQHMMDAIFRDGAWTGVDGFWYSFLDFFQFISIHITIPIMVIIYAIIYPNRNMEKRDVMTGTYFMSGFMIGWFFYCGFFTLLGMQGPYPIIDWTPDGVNDWSLWIQIICCILGLAVFTSLTYGVLNSLNSKWDF